MSKVTLQALDQFGSSFSQTESSRKTPGKILTIAGDHY